ncbi:MAG: hypothetical protein KDA91_15925, partial [Planctomycetaceae bacterium]|nr:hypothetical protein [Planctomycetaceae bacterium]
IQKRRLSCAAILQSPLSDKRIGVLEFPSSLESMANVLHPIVSRKSRETYNYDKVTEFCGASGLPKHCAWRNSTLYRARTSFR